ncbi:MAG: family 2A encapsulin nanocompartment cargo protein cysteine desulfurase [Terracidiphilus sp.]
MSTSDPVIQLDEAAVAAARQAVGAALPDVAALTQMANAFFRALPGQDVPAIPLGGPGLAPETWGSPAAPTSGFPTPTVAGPIPAPVPMSTSVPSFPSTLPELGIPAPSMPSIPSVDKLPSEADLTRFASPDAYGSTIPTGLPIEASSVGVSPTLSPYSAPFPAGYSTATQSVNAPGAPAFASPNSSLPGPGIPSQPSPAFAQSPFSLPLPEFGLPFPNYEAALPSIPTLPALPNDEQAQSALTSASSFYFLDQAGALSQPIETAPQGHTHYEPASTTALAPNLTQDLGLKRGLFDVASIRRDFPILYEKVNGHPLIWLDNAATTQKPQAVIDRLSWFYEHENSNIHRAAHELAARATDAYEDARNKVAHFLKAPSSKEIVFVRGATEAINLVAQSWGRRFISKDDEIVISWIEHHANIVPWQMLAQEKGARLRVIPVDNDGQILLDEYEKLLNARTKLVSFTQVSNALGTITPVNAMVQMAHRYGAKVLVDGAQAVSHMPIDVQEQDCDFFVFSGHKVFAPTGIGVLYGKQDVLADMPPWQGGGNMIADVTFEKTIYQAPPFRFEAGTGNIADAVGLGAAIAYVEQIGMENIARWEHELLIYATRELNKIPGLHIIGTAKEKAGVLSFVLDGYRTGEVGAALNKEGIAVRSGHHCAQPALRRFGQETSVRPSLALYNNYEDIDAMIAALRRLR